MSKTFCPLPWMHFSTRPNGHIRVCCASNASSVGVINKDPELGVVKTESGKPANLAFDRLDDARNNDYMKNIRLKMMAGDIPEPCTKCFDEESNGFYSKRNWETNRWKDKVDYQTLIDDTEADGTIHNKISYLDLRLGNKCNLKCVMCTPHDSSKWIPDWKQLYPMIDNPELKKKLHWQTNQNGGVYNWYKNPEFMDDLYAHLPYLQELYFAGGEPTIIDEHYTILEECIRQDIAKNISLRYNSNGAILPSLLFDLWKHFKNVYFQYSLDAYTDINEYIRYPLTWGEVETSLNKLDNTPDNVYVSTACAVQILNIFDIPNMQKWLIEKNFKKINRKSNGIAEYHLVYIPDYLNIRVLGYNAKHVFLPFVLRDFVQDVDWIRHHPNNFISRFNGMIEFAQEEDWNHKELELLEYLMKLDSIRGTNYIETFNSTLVKYMGW